MDFSYQDSQGFGMQQMQWNGSPQEDYEPRNDFEAKMIAMLGTLKLGQQVAELQARIDAEERKQRADFEEQQRHSFESMVYDKLNALQDQLNTMTVNYEEGEKRKAWDHMVELVEEKDQMTSTMSKVVQEELKATKGIIGDQLEQHLRGLEKQNIKKLEEYSAKTATMLEEQFQERFKDLPYEFKALSCQVQRLERRMENEMRELFHGMYKAQGLYQEADSDSDEEGGVENKFFMDELPRYIDESIEEKAENGGLEVRGNSPSQVLFNGEENEQLLCEDIMASRNDYLSHGAAHEQTTDMEGTREWDYMACAPIQERDPSVGAGIPVDQEDNSLPPTIVPCFSCETVCTPQVRACFGVLASRDLSEKSHDESSWEDKESSVESELQKRQHKKQRRSVTQVWIPRGTLEVMKVFNMTEINLGEKTCVPHKTKKKKRRRKASNPQSGIG